MTDLSSAGARILDGNGNGNGNGLVKLHPAAPAKLEGDCLVVPLDRPLGPYDVTLGDENAITAEKMSGHTRGHGLFDADVIFLGDQKYGALLRFSVPHLLAPLTGGLDEQRHDCKVIRLDSEFRMALWRDAAALHDEYAPR
ncbi:hypothetical protein [Streptomyces microflavus]|uniref:hypothetical protein n=1 Tax=Streptomyces microflavus TaxID=1919 RepID=UPI0038089B01